MTKGCAVQRVQPKGTFAEKSKTSYAQRRPWYLEKAWLRYSETSFSYWVKLGLCGLIIQQNPLNSKVAVCPADQLNSLQFLRMGK